MEYTVQKLATLAGVSPRTLHHYDEIGLLKPERNHINGYRRYNDDDLLTLQQIMFFRELEFSLKDIAAIMQNPQFDIVAALSDHRKLITIKKKRMSDLLTTIDKTLKKITQEKNMKDDELYEGFSKEEMEAYTKEAEERWGHTKAYKQSVVRYGKLTDEEKKQLQKDGDALMQEVADAIDNNEAPESPVVQKLVARHYQALHAFYDPNLEMYRNLADMFAGYTGDTRYAAYFQKFHKDLPEFMRSAIHAFVDAQS